MAEMPLNLAAHLLFKDSEKVTFLFLLDNLCLSSFFFSGNCGKQFGEYYLPN